MKLLDPQTVKTEKDKAEVARLERIRKLSEEETSITRRVNFARENERVELEEIQKRKVESEASLGVKKLMLLEEIASLEKAKAIALEPVTKIKEEAEKLKLHYENNLKLLEKDKDDLESEREKMLEQIEHVSDMEDDVTKRTEELNKREVGIVAAESEVKRSAESLSKKWVEFHQESAKTKEYFDTRVSEINRSMQDVENGKKTNDSVRESNEAEAVRLKNEDIAIKDKYIALEQAKKHLGIK